MSAEKVEKLKSRLSDGGPISFKPSEEDQELIVKLYQKLQLDTSTLLRMGIRRLAEVERVY